jgi:phenylalanyl-tRNA synthetase beta chain
MIVSINWLKKFTEIDGSIDELATLIGSRLVEIEEVVNLGEKYQGVVIAKVVECAPLEGSDHLNVTKIDDGGTVEDVERDEKGLVQVVCGAPNVRAGLVVAWLPPHSTVPETHGDDEPFVLSARKLRGVMSNGMLASAKELDLFDDHTGILEIDKDVAPGTPFAKAYELNDYLLDIENKSLTHRPDTFGLIGFAREVAAIQGKAFVTPESVRATAPNWTEKQGDEPTPAVTIDNPEMSDRYQAVVLTGVDAKAQSPLETQTYLARIGVRPHSAVVDATNYLMMLTGQPLHAFDYDKLKAVNDGRIDIHVRGGREGEKLTLLDGREIELAADDIVIANGEVAVALAGAMGGADTEIDDNTTNVLLESATFNLYNLRNTQMRHGIFSEAITRFTKGQPAALTAPVLAEAVKLLEASAKAKRASDVADTHPGNTENQPIIVKTDHINSLLGGKFSTSDIVETLQNVEFAVALSDDKTELAVTAPYWRADIHIAEDVIEEIGRLNGFDSIEPTLPQRDFTAVSPDAFDQLRADIRHVLARGGANEVLTYSFVHGDVLQKAHQDPKDSYRITNSLSPELQYYRQSITPSLLGLVHPNIKNGYEEFALFELNKVHSKTAGLVDDDVPAELHRIGVVVARRKAANGAPYYEAKKLLDYLGKSLGLTLIYKPFETDPALAVMRPFEYRRSARVVDARSGQAIGVVGEYKKATAKAFKLPDYCAGFELLTEGIAMAIQQQANDYRPLSRYPSTERDICFQVGQQVVYGAVIDAASTALNETGLDVAVSPLDIYQAEGSDAKNVTIRIKLTSHDKTLTGDEVTVIMQTVADKVTAATDAKVI